MQQCGVIIPVYNEAPGIKHFHESLVKSLNSIENIKWKIIYVNDGSLDDSLKNLNSLSANKSIEIVVLDFSRNFGKEAAVSAGIHEANSLSLDAAVILDSDGQHPVKLISKFIEKWKQGSEVVVGIRKNSQHEGLTKRLGSKLFYKSLKGLTDLEVIPGSTDFRLIDALVIAEFTRLTEHNRITRGLIDWLGFKKEYVEFEALEREHGQATYSIKKLFALAINSYISLSMVPLYLSGYIGVLFIVLSLFTGVFVIVEQYILKDPLLLNISGSAVLGILLIFLVGVILSSIGLIALYISRVLEEAQNRPLYIVRKK